jgi:hypothetical protein
VVGVVNQAGAIDTTTALNNNNTGANVRSAVSTNGTDLWVGGGGTSPAYTTKGSTTAVALNTSTNGPANERAIDIFSGQLYEAAATGTFQGMVSVGTGIPTTNGQVATLLPGFPNTAGPGPNDFFFADASDIYVTDDRSTGTGGGLQKWHLSAGTWALLYTLTNGITTGLHGLTGVDDGSGNAILYATTGETSANKLVTITDLISATSLPGAEAFTTLATAPTNTAFRGVDFAPIPEPASIGILAVTIGSILTARRRRA